MERTQVLELMSTLKLYGMGSAYDEAMSNGIKRQHEPPRIVGDLLQPRSPRSRRAPSATSSASPSSRSQRTSTTSTSPTRPSMKALSATWRPEPLLQISAMSSWSAARAPARAIWPSRLPALSSATAHAGASRMSPIWSIGWRRRHAAASKAGRRTTSTASTSSSSTSSDTCPSPRPAASFYSI